MGKFLNKKNIVISCITIILLILIILLSVKGCSHKHTFSDEWITIATSHYHEATCKHKDEKKDEGEHVFDNGVIVTQATHTTDGSKKFTCQTCGYEKLEVLPALVDAHSFETAWTKDENNHWHKSTCGHDVKSDFEGHQYNSGEVITNPTHTTDGSVKYTCVICEYEKIATLPALADQHTYETTWSKDETNHWHQANCEHTNEKKDVGSHIWDQGVVVTEATHTTEGTKKYTCTTCSYVKLEAIPADENAHTFSSEWSTNQEEHWHNSTCDHNVISDQGSHSWGGWELISQATHTENGIKGRPCTVCGYMEYDIIPKDPDAHDFSIRNYDETYHWLECACGLQMYKSEHNLNPRYDEKNHGLFCDDCGYSENVEPHIKGTTPGYSDATMHYFDCTKCDYRFPGEAHTEAIYYWNTGKHVHQCTVCSSNYKFDDHSLKYEPIDDLHHHQICSGCKHEFIESSEHNFVDGICTTCGFKDYVDYKISADGNYYIVVGLKPGYDDKFIDVVILDTFDGKPVTTIEGAAFQICPYIKSITIPDSVTLIGSFGLYTDSALVINYLGSLDEWVELIERDSNIKYTMYSTKINFPNEEFNYTYCCDELGHFYTCDNPLCSEKHHFEAHSATDSCSKCSFSKFLTYELIENDTEKYYLAHFVDCTVSLRVAVPAYYNGIEVRLGESRINGIFQIERITIWCTTVYSGALNNVVFENYGNGSRCYFKTSLNHIEAGAFTELSINYYYQGSKDEWLSLAIDENAFASNSVISCSDNTVTYN